MSAAATSLPAAEVAAWLAGRLGGQADSWAVGPPMGDVSSRKYFRAAERGAGRALIVAFYPSQARESYARYERATTMMSEVGVRTPRILATDPERRFMALEDVGDRRLFDVGATDAGPLYQRALAIARRIERLSHDAVAALNPPIDLELMKRELDQTWSLHLSDRLAPSTSDRLHAALDDLCRALAAEPLAPCHRDYMSRNLMVVEAEDGDDELVVIDHQDLRLGPSGYDLSSLLHDSCCLPPQQVSDLESRLGLGGDDRHHRLVVQRTLKIVGTFQAFAARGAPRYLPMVPDALTTAFDHLARLPGHRELAAALREELIQSR